MSQKENLVKVILTTESGMRIHYEMSKEANERAIELMNQEKTGTITHGRRTELFYQAMDEFPVEDK